MNEELFIYGAKLVLDDVPEGTEIGMDFKSWLVGPLFRGMKMIPPGLHLLYYSAVNKTGQRGPRSCIFLNLASKQVVNMRWLAEDEDFVLGQVDIFSDATILQLEPSMGAYPRDEIYTTWTLLSSHMTWKDLVQFLPESHKINSISTIKWTAFDLKRSWPAGASPEEITRHSIDKSWLLTHIATRLELVSCEFQLAFICFLVGHLHDAFEQWKNLLLLICASEEALSHNISFFTRFGETLQVQLQLIPEDIFPPDLINNNFLFPALKTFVRNMQNELLTLQLVQTVKQKFMIDIDVDNEEDEPVVVEL